VVLDSLTDSEVDALVRVVREADLGPASGIDLTVVTHAVASAPAPSPALELHVGRYPGTSAPLEVDPRAGDVHDLWPELSMARVGRALYGVAPGEVIGKVPVEAVRERGRYWLTRWLSLTDDDENAAMMVLTACRIWRFAVDGIHCSKSSAARWVLERDPSLAAVEQALGERMGSVTKASFAPADVEPVLRAALAASTRSDAP